MEIENDYDFGFSFEDEELYPTSTAATTAETTNQNNEQIEAIQEKLDMLLSSQEQLLVSSLEEKYQAKLKEVEGLILPLLYNLMKNPDKPMIKWANREPVIKRQIEKILAVTRGENA